MSFVHPASLGVTARHMPLLGAAVHVASVRAPQVVFADLVAVSELRSPPAVREFRRALAWILGKCAEPGGLAYAYQDPATGELHRLPASALWQASLADNTQDGDAPESWTELGPFKQVVAERLGVPDCSPALQVVVPTAELQALLGAEGPMHVAWVATHMDEVMAGIREAVKADPKNGIAEWAMTYVDNHLPMLAALLAALRDRDTEGRADTARPKVTTKAAVAGSEAEFRGRWQRGEFTTPQAAREALVLKLNARADGTVARKGDPDFHARASVDRLTRGWFV